MSFLALPAILLAGCGAAGTSGGSANFKGEQKAVSDVVHDVAKAAKTKDDGKLCTELLTPGLAGRIANGRASCQSEMKKAISDSDDFDLQVRAVTVTGQKATAQVRQGDKGRVSTYAFVRQGNAWRVSSFGS
jgi:hypothetical protein